MLGGRIRLAGGGPRGRRGFDVRVLGMEGGVGCVRG